jgi:hypothetical protein
VRSSPEVDRKINSKWLPSAPISDILGQEVFGEEADGGGRIVQASESVHPFVHHGLLAQQVVCLRCNFDIQC